MTVYSHSRLSCFEQCSQKYKLQYVDKVETEVEGSVEAFLGTQAHETLEKLYKDLMHQKTNTLPDLLDFLRAQWAKNWSDSIVIVNKEYNSENYQKMAEKYISDYYYRYKPFDQGRTIALEQRILINLDESGEFKLQGFIDRLTEKKDGFYEIHDYKTNSRLPLPEYIKTDRQLALYSIGVKNQYPDVAHVRLIWHFLKFDKEIDSTRTDSELALLKKDTIALIEKIEREETFAASPSFLCEWCEFKPLCRQWSHHYKIKEKPANEYLADTGLNLVNRYAEIKNKQKLVNMELDAEITKLEEALVLFSSKEHIDCVFGTQNKVRITDSIRYVCPPKNSKERQRLEQTLREYGKYDLVTALDTAALNSILLEREWETDVVTALEKLVQLEKKKRLYVSKLKEK
ncbi:MAG: PD-(D/E)XK nuclease family protein [Euryarchaeota archaeon]|nr:PD-(D/E)XK nuclease family protein [Euryarchaeota archaeon]